MTPPPLSSHRCALAALSLLAGTALNPLATQASPLLLSQHPPRLSREPAPNVIVSVGNTTTLGSAGLRQLKTALQTAFSPSRLEDGRIRLAWQSMHGCRGFSGTASACQGHNGLRALEGEHRHRFLGWTERLALGAGSPAHLMVDNAGQYLSATNLGIDSPWAARPGEWAEPVLACRKAYHLFLSDGAWGNASSQGVDTAGPDHQRIARGGNADGSPIRLPDGTAYPAIPWQTRLYRDAWGAAGWSTLSDLAFHYWSRDLQPTLPDAVPPRWRVPQGTENFGTEAAPAPLEPYWNPRNDPATWQHLVHHTIGLQQAGTWSTQPAWAGDSYAGLGGLIRDELGWPSPFCNDLRTGPGNLPCDGPNTYRARQDFRKPELWHMALNSRGRFIPAPDAASLADALDSLLDDMAPAPLPARGGITHNSDRLRNDGLVFVSGFNPRRWSGELSAHALAPGDATVGEKPVWQASTWLDSPQLRPTQRLILTHNGKAGVPFEWTRLSDAQRTQLRGDDTPLVGRQRVDYLRGERLLETQFGGRMRQRDSRLGDIVNAQPWYSGRPQRLAFEHPGHADFRASQASRPALVYAGANDGMLHAFEAQTGAERLAYVPIAAYASLRTYTQPAYSHRYAVDGHPFTGDADLRTAGSQTPRWRTLLVSGLGSGGRGYFVLDVTDPHTFSPASVLLDRTAPAQGAAYEGQDDVGHLHAAPVVDSAGTGRSEQVAKLNNGRWAVVMGNGANSPNERPVLLIQYLDGERELLRLVADATLHQSNGLSAPRLIDANGDGKVDLAYAGDLQGQLWKFNLADANEAGWGVSSWNGSGDACRPPAACQPFFIATDGATPARRQPITSAPLWLAHPLGGIQLLLGTGQALQDADAANTQVQTVYGLWDKSGFQTQGGPFRLLDIDPIPATAGRRTLVRQEVLDPRSATDAEASSAPTQALGYTTDRPVTYSRGDTSSPRGWYLDLPGRGERVLQTPVYFEGQKAIVSSTQPAVPDTEERCEPQALQDQHWLSVLNILSGRPSATPVFGLAGAAGAAPRASRLRVAGPEFISLPGGGRRLRLISLYNGLDCTDERLCTEQTTLHGATGTGVRVDWREVLR